MTLHDQFEELKSAHATGESGGELSVEISRLCQAVLVRAEKLLDKAKRVRGDSPEAGDMEAEAESLLGVHSQLHAAYVVSLLVRS
ncbi:MAG: hypothetical protein EXQ69_04250 [Acidimicrobiia bacterium]|nr:hypothetical protein [Acidimicrobiia bacterium]